MKKRLIACLIVIGLICLCCVLSGCDEETYVIEFVVDGEVYHKSDVVNNSIKNMPKNPTKEDYVFKEWQLENGDTLTMGALSEIPLSENKTVTVFAVFEKYDCSMDNLEHIFDTETTATCEASGLNIKRCTRCHKVIEQYAAPLGHNWSNLIVDKKATCETDGSGHRHCSRCGKDTNEPINKLGHIGDFIVDRNATCDTDGTGHTHCKVCGKDCSKIIPKLGHSLDKTKHCIRCAYFETTKCQISVNSIFCNRNHQLDLEIGKHFAVELIEYGLDNLEFVGFFEGEQQITDENGNSIDVYDGKSAYSLVARYKYIITEPNDFKDISNTSEFGRLTGKDKQYLNVSVELGNDIDFSGIENWTPISTNALLFNGNEYKIKNLKSTKGCLFGTIMQLTGFGILDCSCVSTIKNVHFEDVDINIVSKSQLSTEINGVGALATFVFGMVESVSVDSGNISINCPQDAGTSSEIAIGAIVCGCLAISKCTNYANLSNNWGAIGGIVFQVSKYNDTTVESVVVDCSNYGTINAGNDGLNSAENGCVAGIVAVSSGITKIERCTNAGNITAKCKAEAILAYNEYKYEKIEIIDCENTGTIEIVSE